MGPGCQTGHDRGRITMSSIAIDLAAALSTISGHIAGIQPVLVLHLILLPVNVIRLVEAPGCVKRALD
jgi:hypothetical protein